MPSSFLLFTLIPVATAVVGAGLALVLRPSAVVVSAIQHFAAGVVFAAAASEILPELVHSGAIVATLVGGFAGVVLMLTVKHFGDKAKGPIAFVAIVGIDLAIDGLVLGIGFAAGEGAGILLAIALSIEVLFLGLTVTNELAETRARGRALAIPSALVLLLPVGALIATPVATMPPDVIAGFLSFGLVALLYLVTEELLVEAHETKDRPWVAAMFFVGFLLLIAIEEAAGIQENAEPLDVVEIVTP